MPKITIPNHVLKKTWKVYVWENPSTEIARKVLAPPWNTLDPIWLSALRALKSRFDYEVIQLAGASASKKACAMCEE